MGQSLTGGQGIDPVQVAIVGVGDAPGLADKDQRPLLVLAQPRMLELTEPGDILLAQEMVNR